MKNPSSFFKTLIPSGLRFPAVYLLTISSGVVSVFNEFKNWPHSLKNLIFSMMFAAVLAFCLQLISERFLKNYRKKHLLIQVACIFFVIPVFLLYSRFSQTHLGIHSLFLAMLALCPFLLGFTQKENEIFPNIFTAFFAAFIIEMCVSCAFSIILKALETLFFDSIDFDFYGSIWTFSSFAVFITVFVTFASKNHEEIKIPKLCKAVFLYTLLPLYVLLLLVLYGYLFRCIATISLPMRTANTFISIATALYLLFALSLPYYECKATRIFKKFCPPVLIPLVVVQIVISIDRIHAHGISQNRYAVVMYTLFTCAVLALSFFKKGKKLILVCPILATLIVFSGVSPLNIENVPFWSQSRIMEKILNKHNLLINGKIDTKKAVEILDSNEREILNRAYGKISQLKKRPEWFGYDFKSTFGFIDTEGKSYIDYYFKLDVPTSQKIEIPESKEVYRLKDCEPNESLGIEKGFVKFAGKYFDIRKELSSRLLIAPNSYKDEITATEPIYIKTGDGFTLALTYVDVDIYKLPAESDIVTYKGQFSHVSVSGFAFRQNTGN